MSIGLHTGNSCAAKLLSVTHESHESVDYNSMTDMNRKFFDKV